jgi:hypothetical protein
MFRQHNTMMGDGVCWFGLFGSTFCTFAVSYCNNNHVSICLIFGVALCCYFQLYAVHIAFPSCWLLIFYSIKCNG